MSFDLKIDKGDLVLTPAGDVKKVFNDEKLRQDLLKIILTPLGSNITFPWYGSPITSKVIGKALDPRILDLETQSALEYAINNLIKIQKLQVKDGQYASPSEHIGQILDIRLEPSRFDARQYNISIAVSTRRADVVAETFTLTV